VAILPNAYASAAYPLPAMKAGREKEKTYAENLPPENKITKDLDSINYTAIMIV